MLTTGIIGFLLMLLYDINSYTVNNRFLKCGFYVGCLLVGLATLCGCIQAVCANTFSGLIDILLLIMSCGWLVALVYCLFFALPFKKTYTTPENGRSVCSDGVYALCRHPGVICFWGLYLFLGLAALPSLFLLYGLFFSILNTLYACFQDRITFPKTFRNYDLYQKSVPFLIPTKNSIICAKQTWRCRHGKKE